MSEALGALGSLASFVAAGSTWRTLLRQGSFRGARFYVESLSQASGRRLANHEYPGRDAPWSEDLGRKQRTWTFTAYMIGQTYQIDRMLLIKACEAKGAGILIHPTLGLVNATCAEYSITERRDKGAYCEFALTFMEAGARSQPSFLSDTIGAIESFCSDITDSVGGWLESTFDVSGVADFVASAATSDIGNLAFTLGSLLVPNSGVSQTPARQAIGYLGDNASTLVYDPPRLFQATDAAYSAFTDVSRAEPAFKAMTYIATSYASHDTTQGGRYPATPPAGQPPTGSTPPPHEVETRNAMVWQSTVRDIALREAGYIVPALTLDSTNAAIAVRNQVVGCFEDGEKAAADLGNDTVYMGLIDLRVAILADIDQRSALLPQLVPYHTLRSLNSLVLAWRFYQDAERDLELVEKVDAVNGAFMPLSGEVLNE